MTASRDPDRLVRAWLDLMPSEAPDRVIESVLQAVETAPQLRRPIELAPRRFLRMNRITYAGIAAVLVVILAGAAVGLSRFSQPPAGGSPLPATPSVTPVPPALTGLPRALNGHWLGPNLGTSGVATRAGTTMAFSQGQFTLYQSNELQTPVMQASAAGLGSGFKLTSTAQDRYASGCHAGQQGTYAYVVSASGETLTISGERDDCASRQVALTGTWWRADCHNPQEDCLGVLDAGTYQSSFFRPLLPVGTAWEPQFGDLTYTVPSGWASFADWPEIYGLSLASDFTATPTEDPAAQVQVLGQVRPSSQASPCSGQPDTSVASTPEAFVAWLGTVRGLTVSNRRAVSVDGRTGLSVDLTLDTAHARLCAPDQLIEVYLYGAEGSAIGAGEKERLILLPGPAGNLLAVRVWVFDAGRFEAFTAAARPVIASLHFAH